MGKLSQKVELVQVIDALVGGVVQDRPSTGTLILGYLICLRGTATAAVAVDPIADLGQLIMRSAAGSSLISEQNFGFLTERTIRMNGSIGWQNAPAAASDPIFLQWFHSFDLTGTHGNVYPVAQGDSIETVLPAVDVAVVEAGTVWEMHRVTVDRGDAYYLPRFHGRNLDLAELRYDFAGKTAMIQFQPASGVGAADPDRVSIFDADGNRLMFLPWEDALGYTNMFGRYDANEADEVVYQHFSDEKESITKCYGNDMFNVEMINGVGFMDCSHCVVEPLPAGALALAATSSRVTQMRQNARVNQNGGRQAATSAAALSSARITPGAASSGATAPGQVTEAAIPTAKNSALTVQPPKTAAGIISSWKR